MDKNRIFNVVDKSQVVMISRIVCSQGGICFSLQVEKGQIPSSLLAGSSVVGLGRAKD